MATWLFKTFLLYVLTTDVILYKVYGLSLIESQFYYLTAIMSQQINWAIQNTVDRQLDLHSCSSWFIPHPVMKTCSVTYSYWSMRINAPTDNCTILFVIRSVLHQDINDIISTFSHIYIKWCLTFIQSDLKGTLCCGQINVPTKYVCYCFDELSDPMYFI